MTGLVVCDRAFVFRAHLVNGLLQTDEAHIRGREPVLVTQLVASVLMRHDQRLVDDRLDVDRGPSDRVLGHHVDVRRFVVRLLSEVVLEDVLPSLAVRRVDDQRTVETPGTGQRDVERVGSVGRADYEDEGLRRNRTSDEAEPARHPHLEAVLDVRIQRVHLVQEGVETHAHAPEHSHRPHAALLLSTLHAASRHSD